MAHLFLNSLDLLLFRFDETLVNKNEMAEVETISLKITIMKPLHLTVIYLYKINTNNKAEVSDSDVVSLKKNHNIFKEMNSPDLKCIQFNFLELNMYTFKCIICLSEQLLYDRFTKQILT